MADHKYVRKYMGKSGKMIYVYKDTSGRETTLNPDEDGADESGSLTSKKAQATISDAERRKEKFAAFYKKAVATGKEAVEASQEASKEASQKTSAKKSGGSGSSKKANSSKQQDSASASSSGDPTVDAFAKRIMSRSIIYEDIPPQYQTKVKTLVESMKSTASSEQKQGTSASSSGAAESQKSSSGGASGGGAGRSGHANTAVKMSTVKIDSPSVANAVDWVKKLFGK